MFSRFKYYRFFLFVAISIFAHFATAYSTYAQNDQSTITLAENEKQWITDHPVIRVSNPSAIAPFIFTRNGVVDGFAVDYIRLITSKVGLEIEFPEEKPWNDMMQMLADGEIDIIQSAAKTKAREEQLEFTDAYLVIPLVNVGREGEKKIITPDDLIGKKIGLVSGYVTSTEYMETYPHLEYVMYDTIQDALAAVSSSEIDIFTGNMVTINYSVLKYFIPNLEVLGQNTFMTNNSIDHRMAALKENKILINILQKGMDAVSHAEFISISEKWQATNTILNEATVDLTQDELNWIKDHPVIIASNPSDSAPYSFSEGTTTNGIAVDYLKLLGAKVGLDIRYAEQDSWSGMMNKLRLSKIDIMHSIVKNGDRSQYMDFTSPYLEMPIVNFGRVGSESINSVEDLKGKRIGLIADYAISTAYRTKYPEFEYVEFGSMSEALQALSASKIDVFTGNLISINYSLLQNFIPNLELIGEDYVFSQGTLDHRIGALKENRILIDILEKGKSAITQEEFNRISEDWQRLGMESASQNIGLTVEEKDWLVKNPVIKVSLDPNLIPLIFINDSGKIDGIAGDYLEIISKKLNVEFEWIENTTFVDGMEKTRNGDADLVALLSKTEDREEFLTFTDSFANVTQMIFNRTDGEVYANLDALSGKTIAQVRGYDTTEAIQQDYPNIHVVEVDSLMDALIMLSAGEVDAHVGTIPINTYNISAAGLTNIKVVGETKYRSDNGFGIRSDLSLLASAMQKALRSIPEQQKAEIDRRWLGLQAKEQINYTLVWQIIGASALIILFFVYSNHKLQESRKRAEAANDAKSNFLANMSHEIRTPLNAIMGFSEAMLNGLGGEISNPKHKEYLKDIRNSGEHLSTVIKDILDLSKIESGKWVLQEQSFLLNHCVEDALKIVLPHVQNKQISIDVDLNNTTKIFGDDHAFRRVVINLLTNAIKFTGMNGKIRCRLLNNKIGGICLQISDNGVGIPPDRLEVVLNPFEQSNQDYHLNEEGTGLGLPIVKNLVELHGGIFELASEFGKGTTASIHLPPERLIA